jgi:hypothetical protein
MLSHGQGILGHMTNISASKMRALNCAVLPYNKPVYNIPQRTPFRKACAVPIQAGSVPIPADALY